MNVLMAVAVLASVATTGAGAFASCVSVREEILSAVSDYDGWLMEGERCSFAYTNGVGLVTLEGLEGILVPKRQFPGPRRMRGAEAYILKTDCSFDGDLTMTVRRESKDHGTNVVRRTTAKWRKETRFEFGLSPDDFYYLDNIRFALKDRRSRRLFRLFGVDAVTLETPARSIRVDVETGNPLHLVRDGREEHAELMLRNPSDRLFDGEAFLNVEDFFGNSRQCGFHVRLEPGEATRRPMKEAFPKGIRYVTSVVSASGTVATNRTTWAYVDSHERTQRQPKGEFRLGLNFHGMRYTPGERALGLKALESVGAKMVRSDAMIFPGVCPSPGVWNWKPSDDYLAQLEDCGLDLDAIIWWPAPWAVAKDADGKTLDFVFRPGVLREYGERLGKRYGTRIAYYEIGNEWDMTDPATLPYAEAVRQVRELAGGIKASCPSATVIPCGFAAESSVRHPSHIIRPMFHENLIGAVQDIVDVHPFHGHSPAKEFMLKTRDFLAWRERRGIGIPWYANETAVSTTSMRPTDRQVAVTMWQKVLFAWSRGSVDYIWYNLRATGWDPADSEQGFGIFTADFHPRASAASFSALASTFRHLAADGVVFDGKDRQIMCFRATHGEKVHVVAGWDSNAREPMPVRVQTDATRAWQVDTMGNRTPVPVKDGRATWSISENPSALRLEDASFAKPDVADAAKEAKKPIQEIVPGRRMSDLNRADVFLKEYEQVYEVFKAMPEHADLTWRWWGDLWVWVNTAYSDGKLKIRITCWDDVHHPVPDNPLGGDCAVVRLGDWKLALVAAKRPFVRVLGRPANGKKEPDGAWTLSFANAYYKTYDFEVDSAALGLGNEIPFNLRVYDNDGKCFKCWMELAPLDETPPAVIRLNSDLSFFFDKRRFAGRARDAKART